MAIDIYNGNNLDILNKLPDRHFQLCYIDPPFNTRRRQSRDKIAYQDTFNDYKSFLMNRIDLIYKKLTDNGSFFLHLDWHEVHYAKCWCDEIFGRDNMINHIIWNYDYGARSKKKWPTKHDDILWYAKDINNYIFNYDQIDTIPYMAPKRVSLEKALKGKTLTDCWFNTIVHTMGKEKTGYPTQKPLTILERIVKVHSNTGDNLLDCFAGSGSFGYAAVQLDRNCVLIDSNLQAIDIMKKRFEKFSNVQFK